MSFWTWKRGFTVWVAGRMFPLGWKDGRFVWRPRKVAMPR